ncbi:unnamed protein product, partial [Symbiodinium microadriaticum]
MNYGIKMAGQCAKLEVPIDMVDVPIKPERGMQKTVTKNRWPAISDKAVQEYWSHHELHSATSAPTGLHHPCWLWGDDVRYGKRFNQKVM